MTISINGQFSLLNAAEKRSKLRLLDQAKGQVLLWRKGDKERSSYRVKSFERTEDLLILHDENLGIKLNESILASFDMNGVSFFFKAVVESVGDNQISIKCLDEFYKSERRQNLRILTFPVFELNGHFKIPAYYESGKVLNLSRKPGQTGLFKNFLKLVDGEGAEEKTEQKLKLRLQDLSSTGMSVFVGPAELEWFRTGEEIKDTEIHFTDEILRFPKIKIVYVVDHIGHMSRNKQYKVGLRFDQMPQALSESLSNRISSMLKEMDINKDFEEFLK